MTPAAREKACEPPSELSYFGEFGPSQWSWDTLTATLQWRCRPWVGAIKAALQLPPDVGIVDALATACTQMGHVPKSSDTLPAIADRLMEMIGCTVATTAAAPPCVAATAASAPTSATVASVAARTATKAARRRRLQRLLRWQRVPTIGARHMG